MTKRNVFSKLQIVLFMVLVFGAGHAVGSGRVQFQKDNPNNLPADLNYSTVETLYDSLKEQYNGKLTQQQLLDGIKHGLAEATGDPYTVYFTPKEAKEFESDLNNTFSGVGAELSKDQQGNIQVVSPISGMPAEKAGVRAKDVIAAINGKTTAGMTVEQAVRAIRGEAGTDVTLRLLRGGTQAVEITITRQTIQIPSIETEVTADKIAVITINSFANDTAALMQKAAQEAKAAGVRGIVLDMRNNPGGHVDAAVAVASQWLPSGTMIMQEKRGNTVTQTYKSTGAAGLRGIPTTVLINGGSASASEIVAAALRDNKQATVVGEKSYGKGVVQRLVSFRDGSELKVTIASWHRPNGQNINKKGITPDTVVTLTEEDFTAGRDPQLDAAKATFK